jgi:hypothetical protein
VALHRYRADFATPGNNPVDPTNPSTVGGEIARTYELATSGAKQVIAMATDLAGGHTVQRDGALSYEYQLEIQGGNDAAANNDIIYGVEITVASPGYRTN